jgi:hypothetical protein
MAGDYSSVVLVLQFKAIRHCRSATITYSCKPNSTVIRWKCLQCLWCYNEVEERRGLRVLLRHIERLCEDSNMISLKRGLIHIYSMLQATFSTDFAGSTIFLAIE